MYISPLELLHLPFDFYPKKASDNSPLKIKMGRESFPLTFSLLEKVTKEKLEDFFSSIINHIFTFQKIKQKFKNPLFVFERHGVILFHWLSNMLVNTLHVCN